MKTAILVIVACMLSLVASAQSAESYFKTAATAYINGDIEASKNLLKEGLKKAPKDKKLLALAEKVGGVETQAVAQNPVQTTEPTKPKEPTKSDITKSILKEFLVFSNGEKLNLDKGEKLVCMFSLSCGHCQKAYKDLCAISKDGNLPKMYLYNYGREFDETYFFNQAGDCKDANMRIEDYGVFTRLLEGEGFPRILAFKNGEIVKSWDIVTFNQTAVREFYNIPKKETPKDDKGGLKIEKEGSGSQWGGGSGMGEKKPWE